MSKSKVRMFALLAVLTASGLLGSAAVAQDGGRAGNPYDDTRFRNDSSRVI